MTTSEEVRELYLDSLKDLTFNSRPVIMTLTELANEYKREHAHIIVKCIEDRIKLIQPHLKLPCLYVLDSIVKNHSNPYKELFAKHIVNTFATVFSSNEDVKMRTSLYKLRQTWGDIFPAQLHDLDSKVQSYDPKWPVAKAKIHINPAVFGKQVKGALDPKTAHMQEVLAAKEKELMELKQKKLDMEILRMKQELMGSTNKVKQTPTSTTPSSPTKEVTSAASSSEKAAASSTTHHQEPKKSSSKSRRDPRIRENTKGSLKESGRSESSSHRSSSDHKSTSSSSPSKEKGKTPPPPQIRDDYKGTKAPLKASRKDVSSSSTSPARKKAKEDAASSKTSSSSSSKVEKKSSSKEERSPSSSPSPPPLISPAKMLLKQQREQRDKEQREEEMKALEEVHKSKNSFRIPKKAGGSSSSSASSSKSKKAAKAGGGGGSSSFQEEGPFAEFNKGRMGKKDKGNKRRNTASNSSNTSTPEKKSKLNSSADLFGEDAKVKQGKNSANGGGGWRKFKETNPDMYQTPLPSREFPTGGAGNGRFPAGNRNFRNGDPRNRGHNNMGPPPAFGPGPFGPGPFGGPMGAPGGAPPMNFNFNTADPHIVETQIIPSIIHRAKDQLETGEISQEDFSELMKQIIIIKEQIMTAKADKMEQQGGPMLPMGPPGAPPPWVAQQQQGPGFMGPPMPFPPGGMNGPPNGPNGFIGGPMPMGPPMQPIEGSARAPNRDLPAASAEDLEVLKHDPYKSISIDDIPREIRFYGENATLVMGENDIRDLTFQPCLRNVVIDDNITLTLPTSGGEYEDFTIDGVSHKIKIGAPTRELWVDGQWYECYFDKTIRIRVGQSGFHDFYLEGPPPSVKIGDTPRTDLCVGFVHLILNADPNDKRILYLDGKPQLLMIQGKEHVLKFVEGLRTLLINGHPFKTEFGTTPLVIYVNGVKQYLRLTTLPKGVQIGKVRIKGVTSDKEMAELEQADMSTAGSSSPNSSFDKEGNTSAFDQLLHLFPNKNQAPSDSASVHGDNTDTVSEASYVCDEPVTPGPSTATPAINISASKSSGAPKESPSPSVNVHDLWSQLVGAGLVGSEDGNKKPSIPGLDTPVSSGKKPKGRNVQEENKENVDDAKKKEAAKKVVADAKKEAKKAVIKHITLKSHHASLKERQQAIVDMLYDTSALQCKNCGLRYASSNVSEYKNHLDWHFRANRREKDNARKAKSQPWYYERLDWIISEEIEDEDKDLEDGEGEDKIVSEEEKIPTVPIPIEMGEEERATLSKCPVCKEEFDTFFKDEVDADMSIGGKVKSDEGSKDDGQWHYRNAVAKEGRNFHPQCLPDLDKISQLLRQDSMLTSEAEEDEAMDTTNEELPTAESGAPEIKSEPEEKMETEEPAADKSSEEVKSADPAEDAEKETDEQPQIKTEDIKSEDMEAESPSEEVAKEGEAKEQDVKVEKEDESEEVKDESEAKEEEAKVADLSLNEHTLGEPTKTAAVAAPQLSGGIKINITSKVDVKPTLERRESAVSGGNAAGAAEDDDPEFDVDAIVVPRSADWEERKPKMKGKTFSEIPMTNKDSELSGLCSIM